MSITASATSNALGGSRRIFGSRRFVASLVPLAIAATSLGAGCPADLDHDGEITGADLTILLAAWGPCPATGECAADFDRDGVVSGADLAIMLAAWGACPTACASGFEWEPFGTVAPLDPTAGILGVLAFEVFDDGTGPALYAGGSFRFAGGVAARSIARWDGTAWSPVGAGLEGTVAALEVFDDGSGPALFAGGLFATSPDGPFVALAKWDGSAWSLVPGASDGSFGSISSLAVFDGGSGAALHACGSFASLGGIAGTRGIARWDGSTWSSVGGGTATGSPQVLHVHDDGSGPSLYLGGTAVGVPGVAARPLLRWSGSAWSSVCPIGPGACLSGGWGGGTTSVWALASAFDPASGAPRLIAAGGFTIPGPGIALWDGSTWSVPSSQPLLGWTRTAVATYPGSSVGDLVLAGPMSFTTPELYQGVARLSGQSWAPMNEGLGLPTSIFGGFDSYPMPFAFIRHDDGSGSGERLFAGGSFLLADRTTCLGVAAWNGSSWTPIGSGFSNGTGGLFPANAQALAATESKSLPALVAAGAFVTIEEEPIAYLAGFDGNSWSPIGGGTNDTVSAMLVHDDGSGASLIVGGAFTRAGGIAANSVARWDGTTWSAYGDGIEGRVLTLAMFDDGTGTALYAGGFFTSAEGSSVSSLARWRNGQWEPMPTELVIQSGASVYAPFIHALEVFDDGSGPALYVGGTFNRAGALPVEGIAAWRDGAWSAVGTIDSANPPSVRTLAVFDDGSGPALFAGGDFTSLGGVPLERLAKWQAGAWTQVGGGASAVVLALEPVDLGDGPRLAVGGSFNGTPASRIALWDGSSWSSLDLGTNGNVTSIVSIASPGDATLGTLVAGGYFSSASGEPSRGLGFWECQDE